jgi:hypothetical protein
MGEKTGNKRGGGAENKISREEHREISGGRSTAGLGMVEGCEGSCFAAFAPMETIAKREAGEGIEGQINHTA